MSIDDIDIVIDSSKCALSEYAITVVPATSGHLRFGAKVASRGRWPPDTGSLTLKKVAGH